MSWTWTYFDRCGHKPSFVSSDPVYIRVGLHTNCDKVLGIALMWTTYGKVHNGIADHDTHGDILNLSIVYLQWCWGLVVGRVAARVLPGVSRASLCTLSLVVLVFVIRTKF